jgi:hypothetical protein
VSRSVRAGEREELLTRAGVVSEPSVHGRGDGLGAVGPDAPQRHAQMGHTRLPKWVASSWWRGRATQRRLVVSQSELEHGEAVLGVGAVSVAITVDRLAV